MHPSRPVLLCCLLLALAACRRDETVPPPARPAATPQAAVQRLIDDLRRDDLGAYAVHALPPDLYRATDASWRAGRSRWPLSEAPLHAQIPPAIDALARPGALTAVRAGYRRQFAGQDAAIDQAVQTLAMLAGRYIDREGTYPPDERAHRLQLTRVLRDWALEAPFAERRRIEPLLTDWVVAAQESGLAGGADAFSKAGLHRSLVRLRPLLRTGKRSLAALGLDLDVALRSARVEPVSSAGDRARVRVRYRLAGTPVEALFDLERGPDGWFLRDSLRHATAQLAGPAAALPGRRSRLGHNAADGPTDAPAVPGRSAAR
ncbi:hypothetical protein [Lysobacter humi (ex Lee et al. 2017)]